MSGAMENLARVLEATGDYRILRRLQPRETFDAGAANDAKHIGVILDLETTGLDAATCEVIEIGLLKFAYCDDGRISHVVDTYSSLNEPGVPIPPEVTELTGITEDQVKGSTHRPCASSQALWRTQILWWRIAPNTIARFVNDTGKISKPSPGRVRPRKWSGGNINSREQSWISCCGGLVCFTTVTGLSPIVTRYWKSFLVPSVLSIQHAAQSAFALMLQQAQKKVIRVWAEQASYSVKDDLKARGYKWNNGANGRPKSWYRDVEEDVCADEVAYLKRDVYRREVDVRLQPIDALSRFSIRD